MCKFESDRNNATLNFFSRDIYLPELIKRAISLANGSEAYRRPFVKRLLSFYTNFTMRLEEISEGISKLITHPNPNTIFKPTFKKKIVIYFHFLKLEMITLTVVDFFNFYIHIHTDLYAQYRKYKMTAKK